MGSDFGRGNWAKPGVRVALVMRVYPESKEGWQLLRIRPDKLRQSNAGIIFFIVNPLS
jgi:hypothetical protein